MYFSVVLIPQQLDRIFVRHSIGMSVLREQRRLQRRQVHHVKQLVEQDRSIHVQPAAELQPHSNHRLVDFL
jgi:hypothetical protein